MDLEFRKVVLYFCRRSTERANIAGQALYHIAQTLNPFAPSVSTATEAAAPVAQAMAINRGIAQTQAGIDTYVAARGLTVPLRSSVVRAMAAKGAEGAVGAGARANLAVQTLAVDYAAVNSRITTAAEARSGQCAAAFSDFLNHGTENER